MLGRHPPFAVNTPQGFVHALTCGMRKGLRQKRIFAMLRAFVDESASSSRQGVFVMAGLVAFCCEWERFADNWYNALCAYPPIPFFRMSSLRDPEWRAKNGLSDKQALEKTEKLSGLLRYPPILFSVVCSVRKSEYRQIITADREIVGRGGRLHNLWFKTPYNYCFHNIVNMTLRRVEELGIVGDVVDFVFDRNDPLFDAANEMLRAIRVRPLDQFGLREPLLTMLGDAIHANDETLVPLQAADLLAARVKDYRDNPSDRIVESAVLAASGAADHNVTLYVKKPKLERPARALKKVRD